MINRIHQISILILLIYLCQTIAFAGKSYYYNPNGLATITGIVDSLGRNFIIIYDEEQKRKARLVNLYNDPDLHKGDYVRLYYDPKGGIVKRIKRMTVLKFRNKIQNLGFI